MILACLPRPRGVDGWVERSRGGVNHPPFAGSSEKRPERAGFLGVAEFFWKVVGDFVGLTILPPDDPRVALRFLRAITPPIDGEAADAQSVVLSWLHRGGGERRLLSSSLLRNRESLDREFLRDSVTTTLVLLCGTMHLRNLGSGRICRAPSGKPFIPSPGA